MGPSAVASSRGNSSKSQAEQQQQGNEWLMLLVLFVISSVCALAAACRYYLGELLLKLGLASPSAPALVNNAHPHSLVANWGQLASTLKNAGLRFDANAAKEIMGQKAGAALKLLYQLKMAVQAREQQAHQQATFASSLTSPLKGAGGKSATGTSLPHIAGATERSSSLGFTSPSGAGAGLLTLVSPKGHQPTRPLDRLEQRRLADNLLHLSHAHAKEVSHRHPATR